VTPTVVVSRLANSERPGGAAELASRLRVLSPAMRVVEMVEAGSAPGPGIESVDGRIERPVAPGSDPEHWGAHEGVASLLRDDLMRLGSPASARPRAAEAPPHPALVRLKQVSEQLRDPGSEGAILNVVLAFAAEHFARVAIFLLRDESVDAIAQKGLERAGGPSEEHFSIVSFPRDGQPDVFRRVLERRSAIVSSLGGEGDERLAMMLGNAAAKQAYVAPIESGGCVAGLLYADNQSAGDSIPDTTALEIVLHEVGLALDGALLRRALADATAIEGP